MGKLYFQYLEGDNIYSCKKCRVHLTSYNELISKVIILFVYLIKQRGSVEKLERHIYLIMCKNVLTLVIS